VHFAKNLLLSGENLNNSRTLGGLLTSWGSLVWRKTTSGGNLALYEDELVNTPLVSSYFRGFTMPGPVEVEQSEQKEWEHKKVRPQSNLSYCFSSTQPIPLLNITLISA
jgi:hypothetical protein